MAACSGLSECSPDCVAQAFFRRLPGGSFPDSVSALLEPQGQEACIELIRAVCDEGQRSAACQSSDLIPSNEIDEVSRTAGFAHLLRALDECKGHKVCEQFCVLLVLWFFPCIAKRVGAENLCENVDGFVSGIMEKSTVGNRSTVKLISQHPLQMYAHLLRLAQ